MSSGPVGSFHGCIGEATWLPTWERFRAYENGGVLIVMNMETGEAHDVPYRLVTDLPIDNECWIKLHAAWERKSENMRGKAPSPVVQEGTTPPPSPEWGPTTTTTPYGYLGDKNPDSYVAPFEGDPEVTRIVGVGENGEPVTAIQIKDGDVYIGLLEGKGEVRTVGNVVKVSIESTALREITINGVTLRVGEDDGPFKSSDKEGRGGKVRERDDTDRAVRKVRGVIRFGKDDAG